jgi:hypothetical protein
MFAGWSTVQLNSWFMSSTFADQRSARLSEAGLATGTVVCSRTNSIYALRHDGNPIRFRAVNGLAHSDAFRHGSRNDAEYVMGYGLITEFVPQRTAVGRSA